MFFFLMRRPILWLIFAVVALAVMPLYAHHPGHASRARVLGNTTPGPRSQVLFSVDYVKGEPDNRNIWTVSAAGELNVLDDEDYGALGLNFQVPYVYYAQKDREDAGRYGRPRLGLRAQPKLGEQETFFLVADADLGFAAGSDRDVFVDENFYDGGAGLTLGLASDRWLFTLRAGGTWPLSQLPREESTEVTTELQEIETLPWEPEPLTVTRETHELEKVTEWRARLGFRPLPSFAETFTVFGGFAYRVPYAGVIQERANAGEEPRIYRELEAGVSFGITDNMLVSAGYRYPLFRRRPNTEVEELWYFLQGRRPPEPREYRLFDEAYSIAVVYLF